MTSGNSVWRTLGSALLAFGLMVIAVSAEQPVSTPAPATDSSAAAPQTQPAGPIRVAERSPLTQAPVCRLTPTTGNEHPLTPALKWAQEGIGPLEAINDYSATIVKRERIGTKVGDYEYLFAKIRHKPFSVYLYFLGPPSLKGQETIYIQGQNDGKMWAHTTGVKDTLVGTVSLKPDGMIAMQNQRYPITEIGLLTLVRRLVEVAQEDMKYGECEVKFFPGAKINNRVCTCLQVTHPVARKNFRFHLARIFVDDELNLPIRYESYDWPKEPGAEPELIEQYTYLNLKLNNGFTDEDFSIKNPNYHFR